MAKFRRLDDWPFGLETDLALIAATPTQLAARLRLAFDRDVDDLDAYSFLPLLIGSDDYVLQAHDHAPSRGTVLRCHASPSPATLARRLRQAVEALGIADDEIAWRTPLAEPAADHPIAAE